MVMKVLVVDDSSFFRRRVSEIINADARLEVIATASNGEEAIEQVKNLKPDVVTMDIEMPVMDGITAVRHIMNATPVPILMFSSLTHEGAQATLNALDAGALDFLPKKFEDFARNSEEAVNLLQQRLYAISRKRSQTLSRTEDNTPSHDLRSTPTSSTESPIAQRVASGTRFKKTGKSYSLTAIGTSTGGPVALQKILTSLPAIYPHPILMIQHMPAAFTSTFASRLNSLCKITVKEAEDGDQLKSGVAYLAPGGKQMILEGMASNARIRIIDGEERMNYKPSVDLTFGSTAKIFQDKVLSIVLTGMGSDGREGARLLKQSGSTVWAQDEETCVVYGMPQAVAKAGISTEDIPLHRVSERMLVEVGLS